MNTKPKTLLLWGSMLILLSSCNRSGDLKSSASKLKEAFPTASAAAPPASDSSAENAPRPADVNADISRAVSSLQNNDQVGAVTLLYAVQARPNLTIQQYTVVQETIHKVCANLATRAANGDAKAQAAIAALEKTRSQ